MFTVRSGEEWVGCRFHFDENLLCKENKILFD